MSGLSATTTVRNNWGLPWFDRGSLSSQPTVSSSPDPSNTSAETQSSSQQISPDLSPEVPFSAAKELALRICNYSVWGLIVSTFAVVIFIQPTFKQRDLAQDSVEIAAWSAMAQFRESCQNDLASDLEISPDCVEALAKKLPLPPHSSLASWKRDLEGNPRISYNLFKWITQTVLFMVLCFVSTGMIYLQILTCRGFGALFDAIVTERTLFSRKVYATFRKFWRSNVQSTVCCFTLHFLYSTGPYLGAGPACGGHYGVSSSSGPFQVELR